jgi:arsenate reductase (thioredoxin)
MITTRPSSFTARPACQVLSFCLVWALFTYGGQGSASAQETRPSNGRNQARTDTQVLFLCPHGAAKSVLASAYFQRAAKERGLSVRVNSAGIEPQENLAPVVVEHLRKNGYQLPVTKPRAVTRQDVESADVVISIGCDLGNLPVDGKKLQKWDDVPGPSEDFAGADKIIRQHVNALVDSLIARQRK